MFCELKELAKDIKFSLNSIFMGSPPACGLQQVMCCDYPV